MNLLRRVGPDQLLGQPTAGRGAVNRQGVQNALDDEEQRRREDEVDESDGSCNGGKSEMEDCVLDFNQRL